MPIHTVETAEGPRERRSALRSRATGSARRSRRPRHRGRSASGAAGPVYTAIGALALALGCAQAPRVEDGRSAITEEPIAPVVELSSSVAGGARPAIMLALENRGGSPVSLEHAHARFDVQHQGEPVSECAQAAMTWVPLTRTSVALAPHETRRFVAPMPCTLATDGEYTLYVDVILGAEDPRAPAPSAMHLASESALRVAGGRVENVALGARRNA